jgi:hypothetical protein
MAKRNFKRYMQQLLRVSNHKAFWLRVLGEVGNQQIWLLRTRQTHNHSDPKLLIAAGFHGEEKAGPWGILKWLEGCDEEILKRADLSFLPVVNPTGFNRGIRKNIWGERTNCGFCHKIDTPSKEGEILIKNIKFLTSLAKDGFLSLHEDILEHCFYIYSFEKSSEPGPFTYAIRDLEAKFFKQMKNDTPVNEESDPEALVKDGIVWKLCDGSFEDYLFHRGVLRTIVTETPGKCRISRRVDATKAIIDEFIKLSLERR